MDVPSWEGRIVIDPTNPLDPSDFQVADLVPGARLVKVFNTLPPEFLGADPDQTSGRRVIFLSCNLPLLEIGPG